MDGRNKETMELNVENERLRAATPRGKVARNLMEENEALGIATPGGKVAQNLDILLVYSNYTRSRIIVDTKN